MPGRREQRRDAEPEDHAVMIRFTIVCARNAMCTGHALAIRATAFARLDRLRGQKQAERDEAQVVDRGAIVSMTPFVKSSK